MNCPACGTPGAYRGLNTVECPSAGCRHYSAKQAQLQAPTPGAAVCTHHWVQQPVVDLSVVEQCSKCGRCRRQTLVTSLFGHPGSWHEYDRVLPGQHRRWKPPIPGGLFVVLHETPGRAGWFDVADELTAVVSSQGEGEIEWNSELIP